MLTPKIYHQLQHQSSSIASGYTTRFKRSWTFRPRGMGLGNRQSATNACEDRHATSTERSAAYLQMQLQNWLRVKKVHLQEAWVAMHTCMWRMQRTQLPKPFSESWRISMDFESFLIFIIFLKKYTVLVLFGSLWFVLPLCLWDNKR